MNSVILISLLSLFLAQSLPNRMNLICHAWKLTGVKSFLKDFKTSRKPDDEILIFRDDLTFEKIMYGQLKIQGEWNFYSDSSKLGFSATSINYANTPSGASKDFVVADSIAKLTGDSLIIAKLAYFGPNREYGHDDWYYVRVINDK